MSEPYIKIGKVSGPFGIKGWLKIQSFTDPNSNILSYSPWYLRKGQEFKIVQLADGKLQGRSVVVKLVDVIDRDQAANFSGYEVCITQDQLPEIAEDEYYWSQLVGLSVENIQGIALGVVDSLFETGANDVLIVHGDRERAIPFIQNQVIINIDLNEKKMLVDWDSDF